MDKPGGQKLCHTYRKHIRKSTSFQKGRAFLKSYIPASCQMLRSTQKTQQTAWFCFSSLAFCVVKSLYGPTKAPHISCHHLTTASGGFSALSLLHHQSSLLSSPLLSSAAGPGAKRSEGCSARPDTFAIFRVCLKRVQRPSKFRETETEQVFGGQADGCDTAIRQTWAGQFCWTSSTRFCFVDVQVKASIIN